MVPLPLGLLRVERARLVSADNRHLDMNQVTVEVYEDTRGKRLLRGKGLVNNIKMVNILEESDGFDIVLDFGDDIFFMLPRPLIQVGKVFDRNVSSTLHFSIGGKVEELDPKAALKYFC